MKYDSKEKIVLDSYSLIAFLKNEACSHKIEAKIRSAYSDKCLLMMNLINLGEVFYIISRKQGIRYALNTEAEIFRLPITFLDIEWGIIKQAAMIKAQYPMSFADCFAVTTAIRTNASIMTGDPEFRHIEDRVNIIWLD